MDISLAEKNNISVYSTYPYSLLDSHPQLYTCSSGNHITSAKSSAGAVLLI
jgi:hypothetical protein